MHNQKNFNRYTEEDFNDKKQRINNIVKFQINYYIYNMIIYFEVKKSYINDIISEFKIYYDLSEDIVETFNNIIENKSKDI